MAKKKNNDNPNGKLDFLTEILVEGQELEINFSSRVRTNFKITGTLKIKEQDRLVKPRTRIVRSPKVEAWMLHTLTIGKFFAALSLLIQK